MNAITKYYQAAGRIEVEAMGLAAFVGDADELLFGVVAILDRRAVGVDAPGQFVDTGVLEAGLTTGGVGVQQQVVFRVPLEGLAQAGG
ncbi:MAG: hypothetical protein WAU91_04745 [Desulfatitalea sp.]